MKPGGDCTVIDLGIQAIDQYREWVVRVVQDREWVFTTVFREAQDREKVCRIVTYRERESENKYSG